MNVGHFRLLAARNLNFCSTGVDTEEVLLLAVLKSESCQSPVPLSVLAESHTAWQPEVDQTSQVPADTNQQLDPPEKPPQELG